MQFLYGWLQAINLVAFAAMGADKWQARRGGRRIPEARLLLLAALGGAAGAGLGMVLFHHKTLHRRFSIGLPLLLVVQLALVCLAGRYFA